MADLNWRRQRAEHVKNPPFPGYGAHAETRPVRVDCSLGLNPLNLYPGRKIVLEAGRYAAYPPDPHRGRETAGPSPGRGLMSHLTGRWPRLNPEEIFFSAGSQGATSSLSRLLGGSSAKVLGFLPTFLPALLEFVTAGVRVAPIRLADPYRVDPDLLRRALEDDVTLVYLDNPNNPTGQALPLAEVEKLVRACAEKGVLALVDEAYSDFIDDAESALNLDYPNLINIRSFSKGCGLAGARVGYVRILDRELREAYFNLGLQFSCSAAGADLAAEALSSLDLPAMRAAIRRLKAEVLGFIGSYPRFRIAPSHPDTPIFLLINDDGGDLYDALMEVGIQTEAGPFFDLPANTVRLRVPPPARLELFKDLWRRAF